MVRSPTVRCRLMDLVSSSAQTARQEDGFLKSFRDLQPNTATNTILEFAPRKNLSQNSNLVEIPLLF